MKRLKTTLLLFGFLTCFLLSSCGAATRDTAASLEGKTPVFLLCYGGVRRVRDLRQ